MKRVIVAVAIFLILAGGTALAVSPVGQWNYRDYDERPGFPHGPLQGICLVNDGTWYSTSFKGWKGLWDLKPNGTGIKIYGTTGIISSADIGRLVSDTKISGQYAHFSTKPVTTSSIGYFVMTWTSSTCLPPPPAALADDSDESIADGDPAIE